MSSRDQNDDEEWYLCRHIIIILRCCFLINCAIHRSRAPKQQRRRSPSSLDSLKTIASELERARSRSRSPYHSSVGDSPRAADTLPNGTPFGKLFKSKPTSSSLETSEAALALDEDDSYRSVSPDAKGRSKSSSSSIVRLAHMAQPRKRSSKASDKKDKPRDFNLFSRKKENILGTPLSNLQYEKRLQEKAAELESRGGSVASRKKAMAEAASRSQNFAKNTFIERSFSSRDDKRGETPPGPIVLTGGGQGKDGKGLSRSSRTVAHSAVATVATADSSTGTPQKEMSQSARLSCASVLQSALAQPTVESLSSAVAVAREQGWPEDELFSRAVLWLDILTDLAQAMAEFKEDDVARLVAEAVDEGMAENCPALATALELVARLEQCHKLCAEAAGDVLDAIDAKGGNGVGSEAIQTLAEAVAHANELGGLRDLEAVNTAHGIFERLTSEDTLTTAVLSAAEQGCWLNDSGLHDDDNISTTALSAAVSSAPTKISRLITARARVVIPFARALVAIRGSLRAALAVDEPAERNSAWQKVAVTLNVPEVQAFEAGSPDSFLKGPVATSLLKSELNAIRKEMELHAHFHELVTALHTHAHEGRLRLLRDTLVKLGGLGLGHQPPVAGFEAYLHSLEDLNDCVREPCPLEAQLARALAAARANAVALPLDLSEKTQTPEARKTPSLSSFLASTPSSACEATAEKSTAAREEGRAAADGGNATASPSASRPEGALIVRATNLLERLVAVRLECERAVAACLQSADRPAGVGLSEFERLEEALLAADRFGGQDHVPAVVSARSLVQQLANEQRQCVKLAHALLHDLRSGGGGSGSGSASLEAAEAAVVEFQRSQAGYHWEAGGIGEPAQRGELHPALPLTDPMRRPHFNGRLPLRPPAGSPHANSLPLQGHARKLMLIVSTLRPLRPAFARALHCDHLLFFPSSPETVASAGIPAEISAKTTFLQDVTRARSPDPTPTSSTTCTSSTLTREVDLGRSSPDPTTCPSPTSSSTSSEAIPEQVLTSSPEGEFQFLDRNPQWAVLNQLLSEAGVGSGRGRGRGRGSVLERIQELLNQLRPGRVCACLQTTAGGAPPPRAHVCLICWTR
jgi:hypothetical protein